MRCATGEEPGDAPPEKMSRAMRRAAPLPRIPSRAAAPLPGLYLVRQRLSPHPDLVRAPPHSGSPLPSMLSGASGRGKGRKEKSVFGNNSPRLFLDRRSEGQGDLLLSSFPCLIGQWKETASTPKFCYLSSIELFPYPLTFFVDILIISTWRPNFFVRVRFYLRGQMTQSDGANGPLSVLLPSWTHFYSKLGLSLRLVGHTVDGSLSSLHPPVSGTHANNSTLPLPPLCPSPLPRLRPPRRFPHLPPPSLARAEVDP